MDILALKLVLTPTLIGAASLADFAHHLQGPAPAAGVLRGLLVGLFAFAAFFLVLAALIERGGIALAFADAIAVAFLLQAVSLCRLFWLDPYHSQSLAADGMQLFSMPLGGPACPLTTALAYWLSWSPSSREVLLVPGAGSRERRRRWYQQGAPGLGPPTRSG
jgi:hypothetical protein